MQRKKDHTKPPFSKCVQVRKTRPNFFLLKKNLLCTQTSTWNNPKNFHVEPPYPFFPFIFLFLLGASWRAGGRAAGFLFSGSRAPPGGGNQGPVLPRVQSRTRHRGQRLGRWRRCLATVGDRPDAHPRAREGKGKEGTKDGGPCMCCSRCICCYRKKRNCCGCHRSSSCAVWFGLVCFLLLLVLFLDTGDHGWVAGVERAGRRTQKNLETS